MLRYYLSSGRINGKYPNSHQPAAAAFTHDWGSLEIRMDGLDFICADSPSVINDPRLTFISDDIADRAASIKNALNSILGVTLAGKSLLELLPELLIFTAKTGIYVLPKSTDKQYRISIFPLGQIYGPTLPVFPPGTILDAFTRANQTGLGTSSEGWSWGVITAGLNIVSNQAHSTVGAAINDAYAISDLGSGDHYAQIKMAAASFDGGPLVRKANNATQTYYCGPAGDTDNNMVIWEVVSGVFNSRASASVAVANGDIIKLQIIGNDLTHYQNGVSRVTYTDTSPISNANHNTGIEAYSYYTYLDDFEAAAAGAAAQTLTPSGIASVEAFGLLKANRNIKPSGLSSLEAFGTPLSKIYLLPSGIASVEAFGLLKANRNIKPSGLSSLEAFGTPLSKIYLLPSGIASGEAIGSPQANRNIKPSGLSSLEAFGTPLNKIYLSPGGIATGEAFGTAMARHILGPSSVISGELFGQPQLNFKIFGEGISGGEEFGTLNIYIPGALQTITSEGIISGESFGTLKAVLYLLPSGIASLEGLGSPGVMKTLKPGGIISGEVFGTGRLRMFLLAEGIGSGETIGNQKTVLSLKPDGITSLEGFGVSRLNLRIFGEGISGAEVFGILKAVLYLLPSGIASLEGLGGPGLILKISPAGIVPGEIFGTPLMVYSQTLTLSGIGSLESFGTPNMSFMQIIRPSGIAGGESFGTAFVRLVNKIALAATLNGRGLTLTLPGRGLAAGMNSRNIEVETFTRRQ